ncbi:MAG TPA: hypothetical protein V6C89_07825 [Drouetiella sp.]
MIVKQQATEIAQQGGLDNQPRLLSRIYISPSLHAAERSIRGQIVSYLPAQIPG